MDDLRCRRPDRDQLLMQALDLEQLLPRDHEARAIWEVTGRLDLRLYYAAQAARGDQPGRPATDPRLLLALWLYATKEGVGSGRELERRCQHHDAYRWLCGGVPINYHTLNDFRVAHAAALDKLFTDVLTCLVAKDVVAVERIAQDGTRVRAWAGRSSFRSRSGLEQLKREIGTHIAQLRTRVDQPVLQEQRAAQARQDRIDAALAALSELENAKLGQKDKPSKQNPPRASVTDADARIMRMSDGGYQPAYNVQLAVDTQSRAIVGVALSKAGSDAQQSSPMRIQVETRTGRKVKEQLLDGGYVALDQIQVAEADQVAVYAPLPKARNPGVDPHKPRPGDSPGIIRWRERMKTAAAKEIYTQRAATVETVNADLKQHRGMRQFKVRGIMRVTCVALLAALTYNLMRFMPQLLA